MDFSGRTEISVINGKVELDMTDPEIISLAISSSSQYTIIKMTREQAHELETVLEEERKHEEHVARMIKQVEERKGE